MKMLQKFVSVHDNVQKHSNTERHLIDQTNLPDIRSAALAEWRGRMG
jgi:hypothetical protein